MKRKLYLVLALIIVCLMSACFASCGSKFTVTFDTQGADEISSIKVKKGEDFDLPDDPTLAGNRFKGWFTNPEKTILFDKSVPIESDITLYALWEENTHTVTYDSQGGTAINPQTINAGETFTAPNIIPTKESYTFEGWCVEKAGLKKFDFATIPTKSYTLYAKWVATFRTFEKEDNTLEIIGRQSSEINLVVPTQIDGKTVTSIGKKAFESTDIISISISATVVTIADSAFNECTKLETVTFAADSQLKTLGKKAFFGCYALKTVELPAGLDTINENAFSSCNSLPSIVLPTGLKTINYGAFRNSIALTEVTIPDTVTTIEDKVFDGCAKLVHITNLSGVEIKSIPSNFGLELKTSASVQFKNTLEKDADGFLSYTIGNDKYLIGYVGTATTVTMAGKGFTMIYNNALAKNLTLHSITLPNGIRSIGDSAFVDCTSLEEVILSEDILYIGNRAFSGCTNLTSITLSQNLRTIGDYAFDKCSLLSNFTLPLSVTKIGKYAFRNCTSIRQMDISPLVSTIKEHAFDAWTNTQSINIAQPEASPEWHKDWSAGSSAIVAWHQGIIYTHPIYDYTVIDGKVYLTRNKAIVEENAAIDLELPTQINRMPIASFGTIFANDDNLKSLIVPASVEIIVDGAFRGCDRLERVIISEGSKLTIVGEYAFEGCQKFRTLELPTESILTDIGEGAFKSCLIMTQFVFPASLKTIGEGAFWGCRDIAQFVMPDCALTEIPADVFQGCRSIESFNIPSKVTKIGPRAFRLCNLLKTITIPASVQLISINAFAECAALQEVVFENISGWFTCLVETAINGTPMDVSNTYINATNIVTDLTNMCWKYGL